MRHNPKRTFFLLTMLVVSVVSLTADMGDAILFVRHEPGGVLTGNSQALPTYFDEAEQCLFWAKVTPDSLIGDFNSDGINDLILHVLDAVYPEQDPLIIRSGSLVLCINDGSGAFTEINTIAAPDALPWGASAGDLDGDGNLDVVYLSGEDGNEQVRVVVLLGNGDGTFSSGNTWPVDHAPVQVHIADVTGDSKLDLVVPSNHSQQLTWLRRIDVYPGNGDGTFADAIRTELPADWVLLQVLPWLFQVSDVTGDGFVDIVAVGETYEHYGALVLLQGDGTGSFGEFAGLGFDYFAWHTGIGDFDGDGIADLAVSHEVDIEDVRRNPDTYGQSTLTTVYFGGIDFPNMQHVVDMGVESMVICAQDIDGNALCDLIGFESEGAIGVVLSEGAQQFADPKLYACYGEVWTGFADDFNGDGEIDVGVQLLDPLLYVLFGDGTGGFGVGWFAPPILTFVTQFKFLGGFAADFDQDGYLDVVSFDSDQARIMYGDGKGRFPRHSSLSIPLKTIWCVESGDLNFDGFPDLIIGGQRLTEEDAALYLLLNEGNYTFSTIPLALNADLSTVLGLTLGDINEDGHDEIVVTGNDPRLYLLSLSIDGNTVAEEFATLLIEQEAEYETVQIRAPELRDLDHDGHLDLLFTTRKPHGYASETVVLQGYGDQTFVEVSRIDGSFLVSIDFNSDGVTDLATSESEYLGLGSFRFDATDVSHTFSTAYDLNTDGSPELIDLTWQMIRINLGLPEGDWLPRANFAIAPRTNPIHTADLVFADFTNDGRIDVAIGVVGAISVLRNLMERASE